MLLAGNPVRSGDGNSHFVGNGRRSDRANLKVNARNRFAPSSVRPASAVERLSFELGSAPLEAKLIFDEKSRLAVGLVPGRAKGKEIAGLDPELAPAGKMLQLGLQHRADEMLGPREEPPARSELAEPLDAAAKV